jgi:hypothetical protein
LLRRGFLSMLPSKRSAGADGGQPKRLKVGESPPPVAAASNGSRNGAPPEIDEDLHSRQLAVYGRETMRRLFASDVLVSGLNGLGAEIGSSVPLPVLHFQKIASLQIIECYRMIEWIRCQVLVLSSIKQLRCLCLFFMFCFKVQASHHA